MRAMLWATAAAVVVGSAGVVAFGCSAEADNCERTLECAHFLAGTGGSTSSTSTGGGGTGGTPIQCAGDPSAENTVEACGVFVQADALGATEDGSKAHPYKTLQAALNNAGAKRVYACGSAPYSESVTIAAPAEIYGGFDCAAGWAWKAESRSTLNGPSAAVALTLTKAAEGTKVQGFAISAPNATAKGESSVAVVVDAVAAAFLRCEVTAGDGMPGDAGVTPAGTATKGTDAPPPDPVKMNACINAASVALVGGGPGMLTCEDGTTTAGGMGGKGGISGTDGGKGQSGVDGTPTDSATGLGGAGESTSKCLDGTKGKDGADGQAGAAGLTPGVLSLMGISDTNMTDGKPGMSGGGGGGGGGAAKSGVLLCAGDVDGNGASGGGGGAGGCGGKGGGGGKAGGSSLAIVSLGTKLTLTEVSLKTGKGGDGGKGASGQGGGAFGHGADGGASSGGVKAGCKGGEGGAGGLGGAGGGGRGGHSVGIAYMSAPSMASALKSFTGDMAGIGGLPGAGNPMGAGAKGAASACWDFTNNVGCSSP